MLNKTFHTFDLDHKPLKALRIADDNPLVPAHSMLGFQTFVSHGRMWSYHVDPFRICVANEWFIAQGIPSVEVMQAASWLLCPIPCETLLAVARCHSPQCDPWLAWDSFVSMMGASFMYYLASIELRLSDGVVHVSDSEGDNGQQFKWSDD